MYNLIKRTVFKIDKNIHEVSIEIDGIYCPKCKVIRPTLLCHEKYNEYLDKYKYIKEHIIISRRFNINESDEELLKFYYDHLNAIGIELSQESNKCCICCYVLRYTMKKQKDI